MAQAIQHMLRLLINFFHLCDLLCLLILVILINAKSIKSNDNLVGLILELM